MFDKSDTKDYSMARPLQQNGPVNCGDVRRVEWRVIMVCVCVCGVVYGMAGRMLCRNSECKLRIIKNDYKGVDLLDYEGKAYCK